MRKLLFVGSPLESKIMAQAEIEDFGGGAEGEPEEVNDLEGDADGEPAEEEDVELDTEDDDNEEAAADEDANLGARAKKRISKLLDRSKSAEAELEKVKKELDNAKKLSGDDAKAFLSAAEKAGILPGLMTKEEASAFADLEDMPQVIRFYKKWLNHHDRGDELEQGGQTMSYGDAAERLDELSDQLQALQSKYGKRREELQANVRELFELGLEAKKAGWAPGKKEHAERTKLKTKPGVPAERHAVSRRPVQDVDPIDGDSLEAYMAAQRRKKRED